MFGEVQDCKRRFARFAVPIAHRSPPEPYTFGQEDTRSPVLIRRSNQKTSTGNRAESLAGAAHSDVASPPFPSTAIRRAHPHADGMQLQHAGCGHNESKLRCPSPVAFAHRTIHCSGSEIWSVSVTSLGDGVIGRPSESGQARQAHAQFWRLLWMAHGTSWRGH